MKKSLEEPLLDNKKEEEKETKEKIPVSTTKPSITSKLYDVKRMPVAKK